MNNSNPLIPQGSLLEQQNKGRSRVKLWVFCVFACHVLFLGGLLMLGCGQEKDADASKAKNTDTGSTASTPTPVPDPVVSSTPSVTTTQLPPVPAVTSTPVATAPTPPVIPPVTPIPTAPPEVPAAGTQYKVAKGDSFYTIGKKFNVTMEAIQAANPSVDPKKLKLNMTLQIPAAKAKATGSTTAMTASDSGEVYVVKAGDNLTGIAKRHAMSLKMLRDLNGLKTDRIKPGDKLKLPAKAATATAVDATPTVPAVGNGATPVLTSSNAPLH